MSGDAFLTIDRKFWRESEIAKPVSEMTGDVLIEIVDRTDIKDGIPLITRVNGSIVDPEYFSSEEYQLLKSGNTGITIRKRPYKLVSDEERVAPIQILGVGQHNCPVRHIMYTQQDKEKPQATSH